MALSDATRRLHTGPHGGPRGLGGRAQNTTQPDRTSLRQLRQRLPRRHGGVLELARRPTLPAAAT
eukprot:4376851-Lingulodinium_polyedra.AAC.1